METASAEAKLSPLFSPHVLREMSPESSSSPQPLAALLLKLERRKDVPLQEEASPERPARRGTLDLLILEFVGSSAPLQAPMSAVSQSSLFFSHRPPTPQDSLSPSLAPVHP